jgi:hypothetical protein
MREIAVRLRDTPVQTQWSKDFWDRKRAEAKRLEALYGKEM